jgi:hypothetical protein
VTEIYAIPNLKKPINLYTVLLFTSMSIIALSNFRSAQHEHRAMQNQNTNATHSLKRERPTKKADAASKEAERP